jgi:predicted ferric reductase
LKHVPGVDVPGCGFPIRRRAGQERLAGVTAEVLGRLIPRDRNTRQYYVCGPDPMMDSVEAALTRLGVSLANIESERYNFI